MLETKDDVLDALRANDQQPYGRQRTVTAEEIVEAAEQFDDPGLLAYALLDLVEAYEYDGEPRKLPVVFARIVKLWDQHPEEFNDWAKRAFFWYFKWVSSALMRVPEVPLAAINRWHTEMRDRYRAAGFGLQPYYAQRYYLASHIGLDVADAFDLWATRRRTELSDCEACEIRARARHHVELGDDEVALEVWRPVFEGAQTCKEEPYLSQAYALLPLLRQGRVDEARSAHLAGYRFARGKSNMARPIGLHLEFCALSGNEPRGLEILAENRDLFDGQGDPLGRLDFLTGVEVLITGLAERGHGELVVSGPPGANWTVATLLAHVRSEADALAARFDTRNGTTAVSDERRGRLEQRPLLAEPLALGVRAAGLAPTVGSEARPVSEAIPEDFGALVLRARELRIVAHPDASALWQRIGERISVEDQVHIDEVGSVELLRAEVALQRSFDVKDDGDQDRARTEMANAAALFEQAGAFGQAIAARARLSVNGLDKSQDKPEWAELDGLLERIEELVSGGDAESADYLTVLQCLAYAAHHELVSALPDPAPEVVERYDAAIATFRSESAKRGLPHREATALAYHADAQARQGNFAEAEAEVQQSLELLQNAEQLWHTSRTYGLMFQIKFHQGKPAEAVPVIHEALAAAARWGDTSFPYGPTYAMLGHACVHAGDLPAAIRAFSEAAARFDRSGKAEEAAEVRLQLSDVLRESGRAVDAVAVLESALLDVEAAELHERLRAQVRLSLARGLYELGEHRAAAEEYLRLAEAVADWDDQDTHTMVACEATIALAEAGHWDAAHAARERTLTSHEKAARPDQVLGMLRQFARLTMNAEGPSGLDAALERLAEADSLRERAEANGDPVTSWYHRGAVHDERARAYAVADRGEDALASAELAITAFEAGGPQAEEPRAEAVRLAALIEGSTLGRTDAARTRLTAAIQRCEQADLPDAARILTSLHDRFAAEKA